MKYRAEIDGLRALAVVPVILFHAGFELFSGGFVGVDVFFVISGYLITTILVEDIENQRFSIVNFYERRARRILPALFFVMLCCLPLAWMLLLPNQMKDFAQSLVAVSLFASNILFWRESDYFSAAAEDKPLLHTWSLAVEEQYYILFPVFLFLAWRFGKNRVFWMVVVFAAISLALSEWGWRNRPVANFYLAPTRAWELLAGSIAAFIVQKRGVEKNNTLALLGLVAIIFSIFAYDESTPFPSVYALVPVLGVVLLVLYADKDTYAAKLLSTKLFVGVGLISYSAYLWHQPLFAFARVRSLGESSTAELIFLSIITIVLAYFSWRFIERPFRSTAPGAFSRKSVFVSALVGFVSFSAVGVYGHYSDGSKNRSVFLHAYEIGEYKVDNWELMQESWALQRLVTGVQYFTVDKVEKDRTLLFKHDDTRTKTLLVGNSHSVDFFNVLSFSKIAQENLQLARFGIEMPHIGDEFFNSPNYKESEVVVICSLFREPDIEHFERVAARIKGDGKGLVFCKNIFTWMGRANFTKLDKLMLPRLRAVPDISKIALDINSLYTKNYAEGYFVSVERKEYANRVSIILDELSRKLNFPLIDRMSYVCTDGVCKIVSEKIGKYFYDDGHHTLLGAQRFGREVDRLDIVQKIVHSSKQLN